ncbi:MAG: hypothetical protein GY941_19245 [Planctomycetes bacterium]|nr:hypothetical protein [Planctomycetota bacterium]
MATSDIMASAATNTIAIGTSDIISLAAIIIAFCALVFSVWQGYITRHHQILSVRPRIDIDYDFLFQPNVLKIDIHNNGLGPAIIKKFEILYDGDKLVGDIGKSYDSILRSIRNETNIQCEFTYKLPLINETFPNSTSYPLFKIVLPPETTQKQCSSIEGWIVRMGFRVDYECMYGKKHSYTLPDILHNNPPA